MQRIRVFLSVNEPILHRLVSNCYDYLLTFTMMHSRWHKLLVSCRKLNVSSSKMEKRLALLYEFWQTRDNLNSYTRLDYTILPLLRHLTYLWLCPSFGFSSLLYLSLLLWLSFKNPNKTCCNQNMPALPLTDGLLDLIDHNFFLQLL